MPEKILMGARPAVVNYAVETEPKWSVGHTDEWQYKTREEEQNS